MKKELEEKKLNEIKIYKKIINILDQIDNVYKFAEKVNNNEFTNNLSIIKRIIRKEMGEIELIERDKDNNKCERRNNIKII